MKKYILLASLFAAGVSAQAQTEFDLNYFKQVMADAEGGNIVVSPLSANILAGMIANGAGGTTLQEMLAVLGQTSLQDLNVSLHRSIDCLKNNSGNNYQIELHNALWKDEAVTLNPGFEQNMGETFCADVRLMDSDGNNAVSDINQWVSDMTQGHISDLLDNLGSGTRLVMVSTLFTQADWKTGFELKEGKQTFHNYKGSDESVEMMSQFDMLSYYKNNVLELVKIPLHGNLEAVLISPVDDTDIKAFVSQMSAEELNNGLSHLDNKLVYLTMPQFDHSTKVNMKKVLEEMGIVEAFGDNANFSQLTDCEDMQIQTATQKSVISVNEGGVCAASASEADWIVTDPGEEGGQESITVFLNHPYCYLIQDSVTRSSLFMGAVSSFSESGHTSIEPVHAASPSVHRIYNLQGMPNDDARGLVIEDGRIRFYN